MNGVLSDKYLAEFKSNLKNFSEDLKYFLENSKDLDFDYLTQASSVFSSNIEGNTLDLNSFMNLKENNQKSKDKEEIENLILAYKFAQKNELNEKNFLKTHFLLSKDLVPSGKRGIYRDKKIGVFGNTGLVYLAIEAEFVSEKMKEFFEEIEILLKKDLKTKEVFYYASFIHLVFVHIHPFMDGNGRSARLLEKWFLTQKLGREFWKLQSEKFYKENQKTYYENINLGVNYYELNYDKSLPFLEMLLKSIIN